MIPALRTVAGIVAGYLSMVVLITLVQETWLGGVGWEKSSPGVLFVAGALTFLAAVAGGLIGSAIAGSHRWPGLVMSVLVVVETTYLVASGTVTGPLWFDLLGSASLVVGILLGTEVIARRRRSPIAA